MADSQKALIEEIKNQFPRVTKPVNYANLILEGKSINATNKNNAVSLETVDTDNIKFWDSGFWFLWQSSYGTHGKFLQPGGFTPDHFVDYCGSGSENYYHSEHGYGSDPGTC